MALPVGQKPGTATAIGQQDQHMAPSSVDEIKKVGTAVSKENASGTPTAEGSRGGLATLKDPT